MLLMPYFVLYEKRQLNLDNSQGSEMPLFPFPCHKASDDQKKKSFG